MATTFLKLFCIPRVGVLSSFRRCPIRSLSSEGSKGFSLGSTNSNGAGFVKVDEGIEIASDEEMRKGELGSRAKKKDVAIAEELEVLWDDGFGTTTVMDSLDAAKNMISFDGGPPRWFCPIECGRPVQGSPVLFFLPGIDGTGLGLYMHHKTLGRVFEVRCLHIPVYDETPFEELVGLVENAVRLENTLYPDKPIYLVGESFGGTLALSVAARNPSIDLVLILVNPATSVGKSKLQLLLPILESLPDELHATLPYLFSFVIGDPMRMATVNIDKGLPPAQTLEELAGNLTALFQCLSGFADIIPRSTLSWKLKLLKSGASYANSRLHTVKAEVLVLASGRDNILPSRDEAQRLLKSLQNCKVYSFKDSGHALLLEDGVHLLAFLKGRLKYRRSRCHDHISDYVPLSSTEAKLLDQELILSYMTSPVMLSTLGGKIVRGLGGVPNQGPVLFVGNHTLTGVDSFLLVEEFLRDRKVMVRTMAHPLFFDLDSRLNPQEKSIFDDVRQAGAVPVTPGNLYRLLSSNNFVLLYPGGIREALYRKGEEHRLFWPDQPEFVRMAARFDATIIPFGVVGGDDIAELVLDYNDQMKIPIVRDWIKELNRNITRLRGDAKGEVANQDITIPGILPKIPGRFYYMFGKPIETQGQNQLLKDKESAYQLYSEIKDKNRGHYALFERKAGGGSI